MYQMGIIVQKYTFMVKQPHLFMQFNGQREDFLPKHEKCGLQNLICKPQKLKCD